MKKIILTMSVAMMMGVTFPKCDNGVSTLQLNHPPQGASTLQLNHPPQGASTLQLNHPPQ